MSVEKMREEFEAAFVEERVRLCGEGFRSSALYMIEENVVTVRMAWWAWQASRAELVIELPRVCASDDPFDLKRDIICELEAAGVKVAP